MRCTPHSLLLCAALLICSAQGARYGDQHEWNWKPTKWIYDNQEREIPDVSEFAEDLDDSPQVKQLTERNLNLTFQLQHEQTLKHQLASQNDKLAKEKSEMESEIKILKYKLSISCNAEKIENYEAKINSLRAVNKHLNETLQKLEFNSTEVIQSADNILKQFNVLGIHLKGKAYNLEAEFTFKNVFEGRKKLLGPDHNDTLHSENSYAFMLYLMGKYDEAMAQFNDLVERRLRVTGIDHEDTLQAMGNYASILGKKGKFQEAIELLEVVSKKKEDILGLENAGTLSSMGNLALFLGYANRLNESIVLNRKVLEIKTRVLGENHADTLSSMNNLGVNLIDAGKFDEALPLFLTNLERKKQVLGENHRDTLVTMTNIASIYYKTGKFEAAAEMLRTVYDKQVLVLGKLHPDTFATMAFLNKVLTELFTKKSG